MTLYYGLFDVSDPENPDRVYSAALLSRIISKHIRDGIVHGDGGELAVSASDPPAMSVQVGTGTAMVQGRFCENDAVMTLPVTAADTTYARIDRVVVRLSASPGRVIDILVKKGTPAPSPVPPGLTRTPETWELSLAQISVAAGATMVQAANITDERRDATLCGWACATYLPSSQLEITGPVNMQGKALTGLPVPSAATDAARRDMGGATLQNLGAPVNPNDAVRKAYVDDKVAGFGISQIAIDADKNWNGKNITNINSIAATAYVSNKILLKPRSPGNAVSISASASGIISETVIKTITVPAPYVAGSKIGYSGSLDVSGDVDYTKSATCVIKVNGVIKRTYTYQIHYSGGGSGDRTFSDVLDIKGGDVITVTLSASGGSSEYPGKGSVGITFYGDNEIAVTFPTATWS